MSRHAHRRVEEVVPHRAVVLDLLRQRPRRRAEGQALDILERFTLPRDSRRQGGTLHQQSPSRVMLDEILLDPRPEGPYFPDRGGFCRQSASLLVVLFARVKRGMHTALCLRSRVCVLMVQTRKMFRTPHKSFAIRSWSIRLYSCLEPCCPPPRAFRPYLHGI